MAQASLKAVKDIYAIGEIPPEHHVPEKMWAWAIRKERHGEPEKSMQIEVVPTWELDSHDVLGDPRGVLGALCGAVGIAFSEQMLSWPAGRRASDGVWAPAWYGSVERSTGFSAPRERTRTDMLPDDLRRVADAARGDYERLAAFRLTRS